MFLSISPLQQLWLLAGLSLLYHTATMERGEKKKEKKLLQKLWGAV